MEYRNPTPYPPIAVSCRNAKNVPVLMELYSGRGSELTALTQYNYQSLVLMCKNEETAEVLGNISMVEMSHMEMLGKLIKLSGGDPRYYDPKAGRFWNASYPSYCKDLCGMLLENLNGEVKAVDAYMCATRQICDNRINAVLKRIAMDETVHIQILRDLIVGNGCSLPKPL